MRSVYRVLAYLVALEVAVQAAAIAFAVFGLAKYIDDGGVIDKAAQESGTEDFTGLLGFIVHGINGQIVVPALALILLVVSFFARVERGVGWAGAVVALVVLQVALGIFAHAVPQLGMLHGLNALALFVVAVLAARRARASVTPIDVQAPARAAAV